MNDLNDYKRRKNLKKKYIQDFPEGIFEVIETDYPCQHFLMSENRSMQTLFSNEEWIDILTKSRNSYRCHIQRLNSRRKYLAQGI